MTHEELTQKAFTASQEALAKAPGIPRCFNPRSWDELAPSVQIGYQQAAITVQRSTSGSPKREAYNAFSSIVRDLRMWEQLHEGERAAWLAFANFVIQHGQLN